MFATMEARDEVDSLRLFPFLIPGRHNAFPFGLDCMEYVLIA